MFKFNVEYLTNFGAMSILNNIYTCKAWTKIGAWRKFLRDTVNEDHYADITVLNSFRMMRKDIYKVHDRR